MYQPIENYGIIGNLNTVALISLNGSVDFMCFPSFDSPTVFGALLDDEKGGSFIIRPEFGEMKLKQLYLPDTNVLLTRFLSDEGVSEITDFMPLSSFTSRNQLIRRLTSIRGHVHYRVHCMPRFGYASTPHTVERMSDSEIIFIPQSPDLLSLRLRSTVPFTFDGSDATASFSLEPGETADFLLEAVVADNITVDASFREYVTAALYDTINAWKQWVAQSAYNGRWREIVNRSSLVLKLLTSEKYGSIIAAPTFGLPEYIGGVRNWDYRYTWIRDASFTIFAFIRLGYTKEAGKFMQWIEKRCEDIQAQSQLGIMYRMNGLKQLEERTLDHLKGYKGSRPVRIGNDAYRQLQLDIYGELLDSVYLYNRYGEPVSYDLWKNLEKQVIHLATTWNTRDEGIWEVRGGKQYFLHSRLMCWVALDRAVKIAAQRSFPLDDNLKKERDRIYNSIYDEFWNDQEQCFVQYHGSVNVDASALLMPLMRFISPKDPRWLSTLKKIETDLISDTLVHRYKTDHAAPDGLEGNEGTFTMCSFWYVECLSRSGQLQKARLYFEKMLGYANHLGLYAEELGFKGEHLGNFPQAFTHLGLITAAISLDKQLNDSRNKNTTNGMQ